MTATYALLYRDDGPLHRRQSAEVLAECLGRPAADVLAAISMRWGILAEGLDEAQAHACARSLHAAGVPVDILAGESLVAVPDRLEIRKAGLHPSGLAYTVQKQTHCLPWNSFLYLDVVRIQVGKMEKHTDTHTEVSFSPNTFLPRPRTVKTESQRLTNEVLLHLDAVGREPWTWLRISLETFFYASTGLPVQPTRKVNFYALALELAKRAPQAATGPGYGAISGEGSLHTQEALSDDAWRHRLRWRLSQIVNGLR